MWPLAAVRNGRRGFVFNLALLTAFAVVVRIFYTVRIAPWPPHGFNDESFFQVQAGLLATGHGFSSPTAAFAGRFVPSAAHPPLYPLLLAGVYTLGGHSDVTMRLLGTVTGAGTLIAAAMLARRLAGDRGGLVAAAVAAVYPMFITADGAMLSESLFGFLVALALLAAYRLLDGPTIGRGVLLGVAVGLAALTRGEALLLAPLLLLPVVQTPEGRRAAMASTIAVVLVLTPWTVRNVIALHRPIAISTDLSTAIAGANCPAAYYGSSMGDWLLSCVKAEPGNDAQAAETAMSSGLSYASHHLTRLPIVAGARFLRVWGIRSGFPFGTRLPHLDGRSDQVLAAGYLMYVVLVALAARGLLLLRRRQQPLSILFAPVIVVTVLAVLVYGNPRFRQPAELSIVVASAVAIEHALGMKATSGSFPGRFKTKG
jgi:4-amino-4-deoxy-L-arabinose transferase-like glycosyltransferase